MISIETALDIVLKSQIVLPKVQKQILKALNHFLAEDIFSPINMPPFDQSAMDGYAICGDGNQFKLIGEIKAGDTHNFLLEEGQAFRIFTGAMLPKHTTAIAKQEIVKKEGGNITILEDLKKGTSIRPKGEEIKQTGLVLKKGTKINPAAVGLIGGLGIEFVSVYQQPKIGLIITGNELTKIGDDLLRGKIYESNSLTLQSALNQNGYQASVDFVKDDYTSTKNTINHAIKTNDLVIITGGISVGDYDFVGKALTDLDVDEKFYKVNQKPGKPIYYGEKTQTKIFALPGNPAAALTCYYVYVLTAIHQLMGAKNSQLKKSSAIINHDYLKKGDRAHLLKAQVTENSVEIHKGQSSAMLSSFVNANCLIHVKSDMSEIKTGTEVELLLLPQQ